MVNNLAPLYHGTSLENAREILSQHTFKGEKAFQHHQNGYVSFTKDMLYASSFGFIVFEFLQGIPSAIEVPYGNRDWFSENQEMTEYIIKRKFNEIDLSKDVEGFLLEEEFIVFGHLAFDLRDVNLHIMTKYPKEQDDLVNNQIQKEFGQIVNVIHSSHLLEDWIKDKGIQLL